MPSQRMLPDTPEVELALDGLDAWDHMIVLNEALTLAIQHNDHRDDDHRPREIRNHCDSHLRYAKINGRDRV
jgi:hypothetical protein